MTFWSQTSAAPSFWQTTVFADASPRFLRTGSPRALSRVWAAPNGTTGSVVRLFGTDSDRVSEFLTMYYRGPEWRMSRVGSWIGHYLRDADVVALGVQTAEGALMGIIFSTPFSGANTALSNGANIQQMRVIEGLAVSTEYRGAGLAGFLIAAADATTYSIYGRVAHLWAREVGAGGLFGTAITTDTYGYRRCGGGCELRPELRTMAWDTFTDLWRRHAWRWPSIAGIEPCIVSLVPINRRGTLTIYSTPAQLVVISKTERVTDDGDQIYEIVWCGRQVEGALLPPPAEQSYRELLDAVAGSLPSNTILFGTSAPTGGGLRPAWAGWTFGRSGAHEWNLYNYVSPSYGSCRIHAIRDEL